MQESRFEIVLCDFMMPNMDGWDCVRALRRWERTHRPGYQQYIVGMSSHASQNDIDRGLMLGMNDYHPKPVTLEVLMSLHAEAELFASQENVEVPDTPPSHCHRRMDSPTSLRIMEKPGDKVCLIATADRSSCSRIQSVASLRGWSSVTSHCGIDTLELLKRRNWGAVFLDSDLPGASGVSCVSQFRDWEKNNRINRQRNVLLLIKGQDSLSKDSRLHSQLPEGVDGAMSQIASKEVLDGTFKDIEGQDDAFVAWDIVTR